MEQAAKESQNPSFFFHSQGQNVAVFSDEGYFLGKVIEVHSRSEASISFMAQRGVSNIFKWPGSDKIERVESKFVFFSDFSLLPKNKIWCFEETVWKTLHLKWKRFLDELCWDGKGARTVDASTGRLFLISVLVTF